MYIPKDKLKVGGWYRVESRAFFEGFALWGGLYFIGKRYEMGFVDDMSIEYHYDDGPPHGTVKPLELITMTKG